MSDLSIIKEVETIGDQEHKNLDITGNSDENDDSGLARSEASSLQSGNKDIEQRCLIIQFKALNAKPDSVKESTFVSSGNNMKETCNISEISPPSGTKTLNSDDGKTSKGVV